MKNTHCVLFVCNLEQPFLWWRKTRLGSRHCGATLISEKHTNLNVILMILMLHKLLRLVKVRVVYPKSFFFFSGFPEINLRNMILLYSSICVQIYKLMLLPGLRQSSQNYNYYFLHCKFYSRSFFMSVMSEKIWKSWVLGTRIRHYKLRCIKVT